MIEFREDDLDKVLKIVHVEHHSRQWIDETSDAHFEKIIVAMSMQIVRVPEGGPILLVRPARLVIAV